MYKHIELAGTPFARSRRLVKFIAAGQITLGGYIKNKIYGTLSCKSGKRMKPQNRVFFKDAEDARASGYRPCGHCLPHEYRKWKSTQKRKNNE